MKDLTYSRQRLKEIVGLTNEIEKAVSENRTFIDIYKRPMNENILSLQAIGLRFESIIHADHNIKSCIRVTWTKESINLTL